MTREEWHVESIGGGIYGDREQVRKWLAEWRAEYGGEYPITLQRRYVTVTPWADIDTAELEGED